MSLKHNDCGCPLDNERRGEMPCLKQKLRIVQRFWLLGITQLISCRFLSWPKTTLKFRPVDGGTRFQPDYRDIWIIALSTTRAPLPRIHSRPTASPKNWIAAEAARGSIVWELCASALIIISEPVHVYNDPNVHSVVPHSKDEGSDEWFVFGSVLDGSLCMARRSIRRWL